MENSCINSWGTRELASFINKNDKIDFVGKVVTLWHITGIEAYLQKLHDIYKKDLFGVIVLVSHNQNGDVINFEKIKLPNYVKCKFIKQKGESGVEKAKLTSNILFHNESTNIKNSWRKKLHILSPNDGWYLLAGCIDQKKFLINIVIIDEGIANYNSKKTWVLGAFQENSSTKNMVFSIVQYFGLQKIEKKLGLQKEQFTLFKKNKSLEINQNVNNFYKRIILESVDKITDFIDNKEIVFLTQPLVEDNCISEEELNEFYIKLINVIGSQNIYFKKHPRDNTIIKNKKLLKYVINDKGLNAEEYFANLTNKPNLVLGFNSTSLLTLKIFLDIPVISFNHLINKRIKGSYMKQSFYEFEVNFSKYVKFVDSFEEFTAIIGKLI